MHHGVFINNFFEQHSLKVQSHLSVFSPPYDPGSGWPMTLPTVDWSVIDYLVLGFQDFVTMTPQGCTEIQRVQQHYAQHAHRVIVLHWPHALYRYCEGPINLVQFDVHEYEILLHLTQQPNQWQQIWQTPKTLRWQSLNGRRCPHRLRVARHLETWTGGTLSYGTSVPLDAWNYDTYRGTSNEDNFFRLATIYGSHLFNIVTETVYDQVPGIITEKTFFSLLSAQIPLVIGYQGIVRDCEEMGFDMFRDVLDLSYDSLSDDQRAEAALDLNKQTIMQYQCSQDVQRRLTDQSRWLLQSWPNEILQSLGQQLTTIVHQQDLI